MSVNNRFLFAINEHPNMKKDKTRKLTFITFASYKPYKPHLTNTLALLNTYGRKNCIMKN